MALTVSIGKAGMAGIWAGLILGLFFKLVESRMDIKVYTLLLNVDYVPFINRFQLGEITEFAIHLVISVFVSTALQAVILKKDWRGQKRISFFLAMGLLIGVALYPTTVLSGRTPDFMDISAFAFWLVGHGIYGGVLGFLLRRKT